MTGTGSLSRVDTDWCPNVLWRVATASDNSQQILVDLRALGDNEMGGARPKNTAPPLLCLSVWLLMKQITQSQIMQVANK